MKIKAVLLLVVALIVCFNVTTAKSSISSYVIFKDGQTVYAINELTGHIQFNGTATYVIQAALDALPRDGGRIHVKSGTYVIDNIIRIMKNNIIVEGEGWGTIFMLQNNANTDLIVVDAVSAEQSLEGIILSNFAIDGARTGQSSGGHGICLKGNSTYGVFSCLLMNLRIRYCYFAGIYASYTSEIHYSNIELGWNFNGLEIHYSSESRFENVIVSYGYQDGIQIVNCSDMKVEANCEFQNRYGILLKNSNFNMVNAILYHNRQHGIKVENSNENIIEVISRENSQEGDGLYDGINLHNSSRNIVTNSIICGTNSTLRLRYGIAEEEKSDYNILQSCIIGDHTVAKTCLIGSNTTYHVQTFDAWILLLLTILCILAGFTAALAWNFAKSKKV